MRTPPGLFAFALIAGLASCQSPLSYAEEKLLEAAEARWIRRSFTDYRFEIRRSCFCPPEVSGWARVEVVGGVVQRVVLLSSGEVITDFLRNWWPTVEELFAAIRRAGDDEWLDGLDVDFDDALGFPTEIRWIPAPNVIDGGGIDYLRNAGPLS